MAFSFQMGNGSSHNRANIVFISGVESEGTGGGRESEGKGGELGG